MPKEKCNAHSGHEARIDTLEKGQRDHEEDSNNVRARIFDTLDRLQTQYIAQALKRLPTWATLLLGGLMSLSTGLTVAFMMALRK